MSGTSSLMGDFEKGMKELARRRSVRPWYIFRDFCELAYCAVCANSQHPDRAERFEARYMKLAGEYEREDLNGFAALMGLARLALARTQQDFLGTIYEGSGFSSQKWGGQYWTPTHLVQLMARVTLGEGNRDQEVITVMDPCCGSGRMLLGAAELLDDEGVDLSERLWVEGTDLDAVCHQMTFLQLAFAGVPGVVRHANSISLETFDWAITPPGVVLWSRSEYLRDRLGGEKEGEEEEAPLALPAPKEERQMELF